MLTRSLFLMLVLMFPGTVMAIDCTKAGSNDEKTICANTTLQQLDSLLNRIYIFNRQHKKILKAHQKTWLNNRKRCKNDATCLSNIYVSRIINLTTLARNSASISVIHKASKQFDFFLIASDCTQDGGIRVCAGPAILNIFSKGTNKLLQQLPLKKIITLTKENKAKVNLLEDREDSHFGRGNDDNFALGDINFDGFDDLVLADSNEGGYGSSTYSIFLYHPETQKFIKSKEFTEKLGQSNTGLFDIDRKAKTLTTGWKDGCCFYQANTWQVRNNKLVLIQEVTEGDEQYLASLRGENPSNYNQDIYVTTTRELIHGRWKTTTTKEKLPVIVNHPPDELRKKLRKFDILFNLRIFLFNSMYKGYILRRMGIPQESKI